MKRENIVGRANVEDTPEPDSYYRELEERGLGALWNVANEIEPCIAAEIGADAVEMARHRPLARKAPHLVSAEKAGGAW